MDNLALAKQFLQEIGMPDAQQNDMAGYALLTLANIRPEDSWQAATNDWIRVHDVLQFSKEYYQKTYAENTRETIRKNCMHPFREAALIEDNGKSTNSPNYRYRITEEALELVRCYNSQEWQKKFEKFSAEHLTLKEKYASKKLMAMMPVSINGKDLRFSPEKHNELQRAILEEFAPRFAPDCECLYVGDTIKKDLIKNAENMEKLGFTITLYDKIPDVILYVPSKNWIYFIEAVTSVGPMSPQRVIEIEGMTENVTAGKIYVTAFPNFNTYKKFSAKIAWETEVWMSDAPDHMIHLDGDRFLGPR